MYLNVVGRRTILSLLLFFLASTVQGADTPSAEELESLGLRVRWNSQAVIDVNRDVVTHVSNDENNVYVQTSAGVLTAFDAENGRRLWSQQAGRTDEPAMAARSNRDLVIVLAGPVAYGFRKFTGAPVFQFRIARQPTAAPVVGDGVIYVPVAGGGIYAYSTSVLEHKFRYGTLPDDVALPQMWRFICGEEILFPPVLGDEAVAFVTAAANVHSVHITGVEIGRSRFQMLLRSPSTAPPAIAKNSTSSSIVIVTGDNRVMSMDLLKGRKPEWSYPMGRLITQQPVIVGDNVFVVSADGHLTRFSRKEKSVDYGRPVEIPQYKGPVSIGAGMEDVAIDQALQDALDLGAQAVRITTVVEDSAAATAGILPGDILVRASGLPVSSVVAAQDSIGSQALRLERPYQVVRTSTGMNLSSIRMDPPYQEGDQSWNQGVVVTDVMRNSLADAAGVKPGDLILNDGWDNLESALKAISDAALSEVNLHLLRTKWTVATKTRSGQTYGDDSGNVIRVQTGGRVIDATLPLPLSATRREGSGVILKKLNLIIPIKQWDVTGMKALTAVGRFAVFGIDQSNRLSAFNLESSEQLGRVNIAGYNIHHSNSVTDQVYLVSSNGEVLCLREIGPTVRMPDLSPLSNKATVTKVMVKLNDPIDPAGTLICEVELPDGTTHQITSDIKGIVSRVYVRPGDVVEIDDPLIQIFDDRFATYHQRPAQQPVDVNLQGENVEPAIAP